MPDIRRLTPAEARALRETACALHDAGRSRREIAEQLGVSRPTLERWLRAAWPTGAPSPEGRKLPAALRERAESLTRTDPRAARADLLTRVLAALEREAGALSDRIATEAAPDCATCDKAGRTLAVMVTTLDKLDDLIKEAAADDDSGRPLDALRDELARRLERLRAARSDGGGDAGPDGGRT